MTPAILNMLVFCFAATPLDGAYATLEASSSTPQQIQAACEHIRSNAKQDDPAVVTRLAEIWSRQLGTYSDSRLAALELASEMSGEKSAGALTQAVRQLLQNGSQPARERAQQFFGQSITIVANQVNDVEPVFELAAEAGCLRSILEIEAPKPLKENYLLRALAVERPICPSSIRSVSCFDGGEAFVGHLRDLMRKLRAKPQSPGFDIALRTLVELEDAAILSDLGPMVDDPSLSQQQRHAAATYIAKLQYQHSQSELTSIVKSERKNGLLLTYAVRRLLWLGVQPNAIRDSLAINSTDGDAASNLRAYLFPDEGDKLPPSPS